MSLTTVVLFICALCFFATLWWGLDTIHDYVDDVLTKYRRYRRQKTSSNSRKKDIS